MDVRWRGLPRRLLERLAALLALLAIALDPAARAAAASKSEQPIPAATLALMLARGATPASPILMRSYKKESEIEIWKLSASGRYVFLKSFPICRWSGALGPKRAQGDRQSPEGFYSVAARQMNPNSAYYLSFDTGYPNAYDRAHGASGSALMVHGTCSSAGCFAMTDQGVGEIFALAREALRGGQSAFQFQAFPFHMSAQNMAQYREDPNIGFWRQLKEGSDRFEATGEELSVGVVNGRYVFAPSQDPEKEALAQARRAREEARTAAFIKEGSAVLRTTYADGGQNPYFSALLRKGAHLGDVSRPEALAYAGVDVVLSPAKGLCARKGGCPDFIGKGPSSKLAEAKPTKDEPAAAQGKPVDPISGSGAVAAGAPITLASTRAAALPKTERAALAPALISYRLGRPAPAQSLIAGAMPILPDVLFD